MCQDVPCLHNNIHMRQIAIQLSGEDSYYNSTCLIHPSRLEVKDAEAALAPLLMITSSGETNLVKYFEIHKRVPTVIINIGFGL
jgi:hypothetical protein